MELLKHKYHVFIFNWTHHHKNALKLEADFRRIGIKVTVVNSSMNHTEKHWYQLDDGYFAEQWNTLLKLKNPDADFIIHIQADAFFHENAQFIFKLDKLALSHKGRIGIYSPNVDFTYHGYDTSRLNQVAPRIYRVPNTDCTYWAINNKLLDFKNPLFDTDVNFYGFGADWYYSALASLQGMMVLRDYNFKVKHQHSTGYDIDEALVQLDKWINTLDSDVQSKIVELMTS